MTVRKNISKKKRSIKVLKNIKLKTPRKGVSINYKLDKILEMQKKLLKEEGLIESEERRIEYLEKENKQGEDKENIQLKNIESELYNYKKSEDDELSKVQKLEEEIRREVEDHPLKKITFKDVVKGFVGAFIGLAVHYTFIYGVKASEGVDFTRATFLYVLAFFVGLMFIYATGFRKIKDPKVLMFMPVRLIILYIASVIMSIFVLFIFYPDFGHNFLESYKMVAGVLLAAIIGACTADLIGKE